MTELNNLLETIQNIKINIGNAIENKGQTVTNFASYPNAILNIPSGSGSGDVKLFDTIEHMQQDENPQEGDLAVVYREEIQAVTEESEFDSCTFPQTVVLKEAFTDDIYGRFRAVDSSSGWFDGNVSMSSSNFRFDGWGESSQVRVEYTSQDGITYTRTDGGEELQEFGTMIKYEPMEPWNNVIGNFMKIGGNIFDGLFEYKHYTDYNNINILNINSVTPLFNDNNVVNGVEFTANALKTLNLDKIKRIMKTIKTNLSMQYTDPQTIIYDNKGNLYVTVFKSSDNNYKYEQIKLLAYDTNKQFQGVGITTSPSNAGIMELYLVDYDNETYSLFSTVNYTPISGMTDQTLFKLPFTLNSIPISISSSDSTNGYDAIHYGCAVWSPNITSFAFDDKLKNSIFNILYKYFLANNQLTATPGDVYKQLFYGKNGVESGTLGIPDNSFADANAEIYNKIQNQYENMEPRILTDDNKTIDKNIYVIPVKKDGTPLLDTSKVTNMEQMFYDCKNLIAIPLLDTSNATDMQYMFNNCTNLTAIPLLNTSNATDMQWMFEGCSNLTTIPELNTSKVTNMAEMFDGCTNLTVIPLLDTSNVTDMHYMIANTNVTAIPLLNTSNVTDMHAMFANCSNLTTIPELDTSKVTNMKSMFGGCANLTAIPLLNTSNVTNTANMFASCTNLTTIPELNTSNVTDMSSMFNGCKNLTTIPLLDTSNATDMQYMFYKCTNLSDDSLNIIMQMCINATSYTKTKTLKIIGLTSEQADKCKTLSNYSAFTSAGWTTGY